MSKKEEEHESDILLVSYRNLNEFLCAFIKRSLPTYTYSIRRRFFWERIFNREFLKAALSESSDSTFFAGKRTTSLAPFLICLSLRSRSKCGQSVVSRPRELTVHVEHGHLSPGGLFCLQLCSRSHYYLHFECGKHCSILFNRNRMVQSRIDRRETSTLIGPSEYLKENVNLEEFSHLSCFCCLLLISHFCVSRCV